jgi:ubiquinone/menaquinone biosynthesis C-methylase UbiE
LGASNKLILNLGCGEDYYGTHRVDVIPTKATTHVFDVENGIQFPDEYFDEIYSRNLLEHLRNVGLFLDECYRVLKKGGKLVLITDNASCMRYYILGTHTGRYEKVHRGNPKDKHYSIFTPSHLENFLHNAGFQIVKIEFIEIDYYIKWLDKIMRKIPIISQFTYPRIKVVAKK